MPYAATNKCDDAGQQHRMSSSRPHMPWLTTSLYCGTQRLYFGCTRSVLWNQPSVRRFRQDGKAVVRAQVGVSTEPLVDTTRVEYMRAWQSPCTVTSLEVLEADRAALVDEAVRALRGEVGLHIPARRVRLEPLVRERAMLHVTVEVAKGLVVLRCDVAVLQVPQQVVRGKVHSHARRRSLSILHTQLRGDAGDSGATGALPRRRRGGGLRVELACLDGEHLRMRRRLPPHGEPALDGAVEGQLGPRAREQAARCGRGVAVQLRRARPRLEAGIREGAAAVADSTVHWRP
mmetsp:Transcript_28119/g.68230  ORF Transcript_28119/g.68230 Transcript_28119/m.68230 type:complete len:290 (+) Transcript_28119:56-925(+)